MKTIAMHTVEISLTKTKYQPAQKGGTPQSKI
jgi:hypothetical protein